MAPPSKQGKRALPKVAKEARLAHYVLRLYVAGVTPRSALVIQRVSEFCDKHLTRRYELSIVDIHKKPALAVADQVFAVPTLIKRLPPPLRRPIGDMQREDRLLAGLDLDTPFLIAA